MEEESNDDRTNTAESNDNENDAVNSGSKQQQINELPLSRIKAIMFSSNEQVPVSSEGLFAMTKACELFISKLARETYETNNKPSCIEYSHLAEYVQENDELEFIHGMLFF
ncbi:unnamed protein product [Anisakis simplex]|nr:unnamed protein product [Anisakis simplex]